VAFEAAEVVGNLARGHRVGAKAAKLYDEHPQVAIAEAVGLQFEHHRQRGECGIG